MVRNLSLIDGASALLRALLRGRTRPRSGARERVSTVSSTGPRASTHPRRRAVNPSSHDLPVHLSFPDAASRAGWWVGKGPHMNYLCPTRGPSDSAARTDSCMAASYWPPPLLVYWQVVPR